MAIPDRSHNFAGTFFSTALTYERRNFLQKDAFANLLIEIMIRYREEGRFLLHEFVVMREHFHLLLTPAPGARIQDSMRLIKGNFAHRVKKEMEFPWRFWQESFFEERVRNHDQYEGFRKYIHENPVKRRLADSPQEYRYGSASGLYSLDAAPVWLRGAKSPRSFSGD